MADPFDEFVESLIESSRPAGIVQGVVAGKPDKEWDARLKDGTKFDIKKMKFISENLIQQSGNKLLLGMLKRKELKHPIKDQLAKKVMSDDEFMDFMDKTNPQAEVKSLYINPYAPRLNRVYGETFRKNIERLEKKKQKPSKELAELLFTKEGRLKSKGDYGISSLVESFLPKGEAVRSKLNDELDKLKAIAQDDGFYAGFLRYIASLNLPLTKPEKQIIERDELIRRKVIDTLGKELPARVLGKDWKNAIEYDESDVDYQEYPPDGWTWDDEVDAWRVKRGIKNENAKKVAKEQTQFKKKMETQLDAVLKEAKVKSTKAEGSGTKVKYFPGKKARQARQYLAEGQLAVGDVLRDVLPEPVQTTMDVIRPQGGGNILGSKKAVSGRPSPARKTDESETPKVAQPLRKSAKPPSKPQLIQTGEKKETALMVNPLFRAKRTPARALMSSSGDKPKSVETETEDFEAVADREEQRRALAQREATRLKRLQEERKAREQATAPEPKEEPAREPAKRSFFTDNDDYDGDDRVKKVMEQRERKAKEEAEKEEQRKPIQADIDQLEGDLRKRKERDRRV